jgi:A/G-specific adenine glycosylase
VSGLGSGADMPLDLKKKELAEKLLVWWRRNKRDFLWRRTCDPYKILIAELMLRKTTAKQVEEVYRKFFLSRYQDPGALANASETELEDLIRPLGMEHKRAVLLKAVGKELASKHNGTVPVSRESLLELPGVGPYIANAVLCLAYGQDLPMVDTNAVRVFRRLYDFHSLSPRLRDDASFWALVSDHIPRGRGRDFNLAVIDHAHNICTVVQPRCQLCPINSLCEYARKRQAGQSCYYK